MLYRPRPGGGAATQRSCMASQPGSNPGRASNLSRLCREKGGVAAPRPLFLPPRHLISCAARSAYPFLPLASGLRGRAPRPAPCRSVQRQHKGGAPTPFFYACNQGLGRARMPKRTDISSILIIGAGPIVIGQACEFDYSGTQACKALKDEGFRIVLVNSNPATIMTDPELADATYVEPITPEIVAKIIEKERPDALLPTMGGQTALNTALSLKRMGVLDQFGVKMIGATAEAIDKAEDRELFREA